MALHLLCVAILVLAAHLAPTEAAVRVWGIRASGIDGDFFSPPDAYVKVWCSSVFGGMTDFYRDSYNPSWNAEFNFPNCEVDDILKLEVWDKDLNLDDHLGTCIMSVKDSAFIVTCSLGSGKLVFLYEFTV